MKNILPFMLIFLFLQNAQAEEQKLSQAYEQQLIERVKGVFSLEAPKKPVERPVCATPIFVEINFNKHRFSAKTAGLLESYISRPDFEGEPEYVYDTPDGYFKIHYTRTGTHAVFEADVDTMPQDQVPDYINRCAEIFDLARAKEVDSLRYHSPPSDDWYPNNGGDGKYDIYVKNINPKYLGYTEPETSSANPIVYTSYIVVRNDYSAYGGHEDKLDNLRATAAHELFHAIQMGYDATEFEFDDQDDPNTYKPYWMEMSAVWMEEMVYDAVNDYLSYLSSFFRHPDWSLSTFSYFNSVPDSALHAYGGCVWPMYLQERFDITIIRDIWEECAKVPGHNVIHHPDVSSATEKALQARGATFEEAFREFTLWNYFTGDRARTGMYYSEGDLFPQVKVDTSFHFHTIYPVHASSGPFDLPHSLSSNYLIFVPDPALEEGGVRIEFSGISGDYKVSAIGYKSYPLTPFETTVIGMAKIRDWHSYTEVVMIPAVVTRSPDDAWLYEYHAYYDSSLQGDAILPDEDEVLQNYPNPFVIETESGRTFFPFVLLEPSRVRVDIFALSGERIRTIIPRYDLRLGREEYVDESVLKELDMFWDGQNESGEYVSSGVYLYTFRTDRTTVVKKLAVIR
jgi:hypothetical protein